jgi:hypothetical protein
VRQELLCRERILFDETGNERGWLVEAAIRLQFGRLGPTAIHAGKTLFDTFQMKGESMVKGIYAGDENSTAEICTEVAYFLGNYAEESEGRTSGVVTVEMETVSVKSKIAWRRHVAARASAS